MKMNYVIASFMMLSFGFMSCDKDENISDHDEKMIELSFSGSADDLQKESINSRTIINYTGANPGNANSWPNQITFDTQESVSVFPNKANASNYKFDNGENNVNIFSGEVTESDAANVDGFIVLYPYQESNGITNYTDSNNFTINVEIPTTQTVNNDNNIDNNPSFALPNAEGKFNLANLAALLRLEFQGTDQTKLSMITSLSLTTDYATTGTLTIPVANGTASGSGTATSTTLTILPPIGGFLLNQGYYVVVRGTNYSGDLKASLTNGNTVVLHNFPSTDKLITKPKTVTPITITLN